jgi:threonine synthase
MAADAVKESNGFAIAVTDEEIISAQKEFITQTGILCEPSCASVYAGYKKLLSTDMLNSSQSNLLLITGNGLKDIATLRKIGS